MGQLATLLEVQEHDTATDRLRHRRATLPERAELAQREAEGEGLDRRLADLRERRDVYLREEERLEGEARALEDREREVDRRMYSGEVSSPRELQAMQADVDQLRRHRRMVEDRELEAMEAREALDREVAGVEAERATVQAELDRLGASLADQEAAIDAELAVELEARDKLASDIAADLLALYERCRERARGVGVARLVGSTCQGCHLSIPATEVDRIRRAPPDTVAHCDNCGCILVPA